MTQVADCPIRFSACVSPMVVTVFPSPNGVGFTEVTKTKLPCGFEKRSLRAFQVTLATPLPMGMSS